MSEIGRADAELWIRPVGPGAEGLSEVRAVWRFRLLLVVVLIALVAIIFLVYQSFSGAYSDTPVTPSPAGRLALLHR